MSELHKPPLRAHSLVASFGADTAEDLAWELRRMADDIERGQVTVGCSGSPSVGTIYSYRVSPDQTHDAYFQQINEVLAAKAPQRN